MIAIAALAAFAGAFVQSATGFGFALVLSPALFAVLEPVEAVTTLLALGFVLNLLVFLGHGQPSAVDWRAIVPMLLCAIPGLAVGFVVLEALSKQALQMAVGVAVLLAAGGQLRQRRRRKRPALPAWAGWAVGLLSGTLTTSISVSGPPLVLWLEAREVDPREFRASLAASFLALNLAGCGLLLMLEGSAALDAGVVLPLLGVVAAGHVLGALAFRRLDRERFFVFVLLLVVVTGVASVAAGLAG